MSVATNAIARSPVYNNLKSSSNSSFQSHLSPVVNFPYTYPGSTISVS